MIPELPASELRDAITRQEWERASEILSRHTLLIQRGLDNPPPDIPREQWEALIAEQEAFKAELVTARDHVGQLIERITRHKAGAQAYRKGGK